jgi:glutaconate CoA-transferase subunit B
MSGPNTMAGQRGIEERPFTATEMMIVAAARQLAGERVCFVGVGPPNVACNLARRTVAPDLELVYESGLFGSAPARLPLSIGDPTLVTGSIQVTSMFELFAYYLEAGLIDVGFLGASQIDRHGNINTTVIGEYDRPKVRLPGSGGACEIAINAKKVFVIMPQSKRSFVERIDFTTSPGHLTGARPKGWGAGPTVVVTGLGVYGFDDRTAEMYLASLHPGATLDEVRANTGWDITVAADLAQTPPPTAEELRLIREELDPAGAYTR